MIVVVVQRVAIVVMPMPVGARLGRTGDRKRGHRKHGNRSQNRSCLFHRRSFKKKAPSQANATPAQSFRPVVIPSAFGAAPTLPFRGARAKRSLGRAMPAGKPACGRRMDAVLKRYFPKLLHFSPNERSSPGSNVPSRNSPAASVVDVVRTSENAAFGSFSQTARSSAVTVSQPNRNMYRPGSVTRPACCHVTLSTNHFFPSKVRNRHRAAEPGFRHAGPERFFARPHFEGVEMQGERRQGQPQIMELFGSRVVAINRSAVACGSMRANIH